MRGNCSSEVHITERTKRIKNRRAAGRSKEERCQFQGFDWSIKRPMCHRGSSLIRQCKMSR